ncbi:MAG: HD domain-containing protein [Clostridia bacterium]|nr:HD domain-containing protein [Clostridia bacterium]
MEKTVEKAKEYVKELFRNEFSGHDYFHTLRVYNTAVALSEKENADLFIVSLAALLHDADDVKLSPETAEKKDNAVNFMKSQGVDEDIISRVVKAIDEISFSGTGTVVPSTIEGKCVQDADRLDAIGAIGIARAFSYGGNHNREMHNPDIPPNLNMTKEEYRKSNSTSVNHFYEKLLKLKDLMNTDEGKRIAEKRDRYMREFLDEFLSEWEGKR